MTKLTADNIAERLHQLIGDDSEDSAKVRTRLRILDVSAEHFLRFGYRRTSISGIARDAGIAKGTLYLYFDSKETLAFACIAREKMPMVEGFRAVMALPEPERLEAYLHMVIRFTLTAPLSRVLMRGEGDLEQIMSAYLKKETSAKDDEERSQGLMDMLTTWVAPDIPAEERRQLSIVLLLTSRMMAHTPDVALLRGDLSDDEIEETWVKLMVAGVKGFAS